MSKKVVKQGNNKQFAGLIVIVVIVGVAALGYAMTRPAAQALTVDPTIPAGTAAPYVMGNPDAPVQVVEFGDFECIACGQFAAVTEPDVRTRLVNTGIVSFRFMDFPLSMHPNTWPAHIAASCASDQNKFWEMHDVLFAGQTEWNGEATRNPMKMLRRYAEQVGLDMTAWEQCVTTQKPVPRIKANVAEGMRRNIGSTPTFIIGTRQLPGALSYDQFKMYVDSALADQAKAAKDAPKAGTKKGAH